ncbi:MAG: sulfotransferase [Phycisphaerales bacterium]|nr:sulfotransferase [Phycisphaerales bacterium]
MPPQRDPYESMIRQAMAHQQAGRGGDAESIYTWVLSKDPQHADALHLRGLVRIERGLPESAIEDIRGAIEVRGDVAPFHFNLGNACRLAGRLDEAVSAYRHVLTLMPGHGLTRVALARVHEMQGDAAAAREALAGLESGEHADAAAVILARLEAREGAVGAARERLRARVERLADDRRGVDLLFTYAQTCDRAGDVEAAGAALGRANRAKGARFDGARFRREIDGMLEVFDLERVRGLRDAAGREGAGLIYVVGMPRSGTSLVEQILASHPQVGGGGELTVLPRLERVLAETAGSRAGYPGCLGSVAEATLEAAGREGLGWYDAARPSGTGAGMRLTDKLPSNFRRLGLAALLFPGARVVHCVRDAEDTCLSCYMQEFAGVAHPYAYDLEHLAVYFHQYERVMAFWQAWGIEVVEVAYEALVSDQRTVTEGLLAGLGLEWDEACLRPHESTRRVATASYAQVREPVHARSVRRADRYAALMAPFRAALARERGTG